MGVFSPLIIDLNNNGFHFNNIVTGSNAYFDFTGNHFATHTSWDTGADGFLARDLNSDGQINDITEMFGDNGGTSAWTKLAGLDSNASGTITSADTAFSTLRIWTDANHNGHTETGELQTLAAAGIASLTLQQNSNTSTQDGQTLSGNATVTLTGGGTRGMTDVFLTNDKVDGWYIGDGTTVSTDVDSEALFLPLSRGYGTLTSWQVAMTQDAALMTQGEQIHDFVSPELQQVYSLTESFLFEWAGVEGVNPTSRGAYIDARKLVFLEKLLNTPFVNVDGGSNPQGTPQGLAIMQAWQDAFLEFHDRLSVQGPLAGVFLNARYDFVVDKLVWDESLSAITARAASLAPAYSDLSHWLSYWSEVGGILTRHAGDFSQTSAQVAAAIDTAAGHHVPITNYVTLGTSGADNMVVFNNADHFINGLAGNDTIQAGGTGVAYVMGEDGNDVLSWAGAASGTLDGGAGNDNLTGNAGKDLLIGGAGNDYLQGNGGKDTYAWGNGLGNDTVYDNGDPDDGKDAVQLTNLNAADISYAIDSFGSLTIKAIATNETLTLQNQYNPSVPGNFIETLKFADGSAFDLNSDGFHLSAAAGGTLYGGYGNDILDGSTGAETLLGNRGNDILQGFGGADTLDGGTGNDKLYGGDGNDRYNVALTSGTATIIEATGTDTVAFGAGITSGSLSFFRPANSNELHINLNDAGTLVIQGQFAGGGAIETFSFADGSSLSAAQVAALTATPPAPPAGVTVNGGAGNDTISGDNLGNDLLQGQGGNDLYFINSFTGSDTISDTSGTDTVVFNEGIDFTDLSFAKSGNNFSMTTTSGQVITVTNQFSTTPVEQLSFSDGTVVESADFLSLATAGSVVGGTSGNDSLYGNGGPDTINADAGNDLAVGNDGADQVNGGTGNDSLWGSNGADTLHGDAGDDQLNGDAGSDKIYGDAGNDSLWGGGGSDTLRGEGGDDALYGNDGADALIGGDGVDWMEGGNGDDTLKGKAGGDGLTGGSGNDVFLYDDVTDAPVGAADWIYDFTQGVDKVSLTAVVEGIAFIGTSAFSGLGSAQLHQFASGGNTVLELDADGSGTADMQFVMVGSITFTQNDFI